MVDHDESFPVFSSVMFEADMWTMNQPLYIHDAVVYSKTLVCIMTYTIKLWDIYRIFGKTAMRSATTFEAIFIIL